MKGNAHGVKKDTLGRDASLGAMGAVQKAISGRTAQKAKWHLRLGIKEKSCATTTGNRDTSSGNAQRDRR